MSTEVSRSLVSIEQRKDLELMLSFAFFFFAVYPFFVITNKKTVIVISEEQSAVYVTTCFFFFSIFGIVLKSRAEMLICLIPTRCISITNVHLDLKRCGGIYGH